MYLPARRCTDSCTLKIQFANPHTRTPLGYVDIQGCRLKTLFEGRGHFSSYYSISPVMSYMTENGILLSAIGQSSTPRIEIKASLADDDKPSIQKSFSLSVLGASNLPVQSTVSVTAPGAGSKVWALYL